MVPMVSGYAILRLWDSLNTTKSALLNIGSTDLPLPKIWGDSSPGPGSKRGDDNGINRSLYVRSSPTAYINLVFPTEMPPSCVSVITTMRLQRLSHGDKDVSVEKLVLTQIRSHQITSFSMFPFKRSHLHWAFEGPQFKRPVLGRGPACPVSIHHQRRAITGFLGDLDTVPCQWCRNPRLQQNSNEPHECN